MKPKSLCFRSLWLVLIVAAGSSFARGEDLAGAREHYRRGTTLYDLRRFIEAAKEYEAAFELKDDPSLLFNIGQAYRNGGQYEDAIGAYRSYLRRVPRAANRSDIEQRIAELQRLIEERKQQDKAPPLGTLPSSTTAPATTSTPPPSANERSTPTEAPQPTAAATATPIATASTTPAQPRPERKVLYAGVGVAAGGLVLGVVGGALLGLSASASNDVTRLPAGSVFDPQVEQRALTAQNAGIALLAVGGAAVAAGIVTAVVGARRSRAAHAHVLPLFGPGHAGLSFHSNF